MKKICTLIFLTLLLTGCYRPEIRDNAKEYDWAIDFCGGKSQIYSFNAFEALASDVKCKDRRSAIVPKFYK